MATTQYIGARYVPIFFTNPDDNSNTWKSGIAYDPLTVVTDLNQSYTSKIPVPASVGRPSENPTYWIATGSYNAQVEQYRQEVGELSNTVSELEENINQEFEDFTEEVNDRVGSFENEVNNRNYTFNGSKVVGHAGAGSYATANSKYGVDLALSLGADAVELDVQITSDHVVVCHHNPVVDGVVLRENPISVVGNIVISPAGYYWPELKIPELSWCLRSIKNAQKTAVLEFKWEAENHMTVEDLPYVYQTIKNANISDVVFISFVREPLLAYKALDKSARTIWLIGLDTPVTYDNIDACAADGFWGIGMPRTTAPEYFVYAHSKGLVIDAFTFEAWDNTIINSLNTGVEFLTTNSILTCGDWVHAKTDPGFVSTAPAVQGVPMISKYFSTINDPAYPYFCELVSRTNTQLSDYARLYAALSRNRATSMPIPVRAGETLNFDTSSVYDCAVQFYNGSQNTLISDSGWTNAPVTVPTNAVVAFIVYRRKDNSNLDFRDLGQMRNIFQGKS